MENHSAAFYDIVGKLDPDKEPWQSSIYNETSSAGTNGSNASTSVLTVGNSSFWAAKNSTVMTACVMFAAGVVGNVLALFVLATSSADQRKTLFYKLVAGLAVTDLLGTVATSPVVIAVYVNNLRWIGGDAMCHYFSFFMIFACFASMLIVCAMSVERYICVRHPYTYYTKLSRTKYANLTLLTCWLTAAGIAALPVAGVGRNVKQYPFSWCFFDYLSKDAPDVAFNFLFVVTSLACLVVTFVANLSVIYTLVTLRSRQSELSAERPMTSSSRSFSSSSFASSSASSSLQRRRKRATTRRFGEVQMMLMLVGVTVIFTACFAPLTIFVLVCQTPYTLDRNWVLHIIRLASFNPILDPWVYILFRRELAWRVVRLFRWILRLPPLQPPGYWQQQQKQLGQDRKSELSVPARNGSFAITPNGFGSISKAERASLEVALVAAGQCGAALNGGEFRAGTGKAGERTSVDNCVPPCASRRLPAGPGAGSRRRGADNSVPARGVLQNHVDDAVDVDDHDYVLIRVRGAAVDAGGEREDAGTGTEKTGSCDRTRANWDRRPSLPSRTLSRETYPNEQDEPPHHRQQHHLHRRCPSMVSFCSENQPLSPFPASHQQRSSALDNVREHPEEELLPGRSDRYITYSPSAASLPLMTAPGAAGPTTGRRRLSWSDPYNPSCFAFCFQCLCLPPAPSASGGLAYHNSGREMSFRRFSSNTQRAASVPSYTDVRVSQLR